MRYEPPWNELDAGIRETVRALWHAGFDPVDSGDGCLVGIKDGMEGALPIPHVFMTCDPGKLVEEAHRLQGLLESWKIPGGRVEASYAPADGRGLLVLLLGEPCAP